MKNKQFTNINEIIKKWQALQKEDPSKLPNGFKTYDFNWFNELKEDKKKLFYSTNADWQIKNNFYQRLEEIVNLALLDPEIKGISFSQVHFPKKDKKTNFKLDFIKFEKPIEFANCHFTGRINFEGFVFNNAISFKRSHFELGCNFKNAVLNAEANFTETIFGTTARFDNTQFNKHVRFNIAKFKKLVSFNKAKFETVSFSKSEFFNNGSFIKTNFNGFSSFASVNVHGSLFFKESIFRENVSFNKACIKGVAQFIKMVISGLANFKEVKFGSITDFHSSFFAGNTYFQNNTFSGEVIFEKIIVHKVMEIIDPTFQTGNTVIFNYIKVNSRLSIISTNPSKKIFSHTVHFKLNPKDIGGEIYFENINSFFILKKDREFLEKMNEEKDKKVIIGNGWDKYEFSYAIHIPVKRQAQNYIRQFSEIFVRYANNLYDDHFNVEYEHMEDEIVVTFHTQTKIDNEYFHKIQQDFYNVFSDFLKTNKVNIPKELITKYPSEKALVIQGELYIDLYGFINKMKIADGLIDYKQAIDKLGSVLEISKKQASSLTIVNIDKLALGDGIIQNEGNDSFNTISMTNINEDFTKNYFQLDTDFEELVKILKNKNYDSLANQAELVKEELREAKKSKNNEDKKSAIHSLGSFIKNLSEKSDEITKLGENVGKIKDLAIKYLPLITTYYPQLAEVISKNMHIIH